jgi:hypothetical protein
MDVPEIAESTLSPLNLGSSLSVVWNPTLDRILAGFSFDDLRVKVPCGKIDERDVALHTPENEYAERCGRRELGDETDAEVLKYLTFYDQFMSPRRWTKTTDEGRVELAQFHFLGILERQVDCPWRPVESAEMDRPKWWSPFDFLRLNDTPRYVKTGDHAGEKRNPFHQLAVCEAIKFLSKHLDQSPHLHRLVSSLIRIPIDDQKSVDLHDYPYEIRALMRTREI